MITSLVALFLFSAYAEAGDRGHHDHPSSHGRAYGHSYGHSYSHGYVAPPRVAFRVVIDPWAVSYAPAPRPGYVWQSGYSVHGRWIPGHWVPAYSRAGSVWVSGHWEGRDYVDGYWRSYDRPGYVWIDGDYDGRGSWRDGYWSEGGPRDDRGHVEAEVHHEYR